MNTLPQHTFAARSRSLLPCRSSPLLLLHALPLLSYTRRAVSAHTHFHSTTRFNVGKCGLWTGVAYVQYAHNGLSFKNVKGVPYNLVNSIVRKLR